jgi:hypothetical protein
MQSVERLACSRGVLHMQCVIQIHRTTPAVCQFQSLLSPPLIPTPTLTPCCPFPLQVATASASVGSWVWMSLLGRCGSWEISSWALTTPCLITAAAGWALPLQLVALHPLLELWL